MTSLAEVNIVDILIPVQVIKGVTDVSSDRTDAFIAVFELV